MAVGSDELHSDTCGMELVVNKTGIHAESICVSKSKQAKTEPAQRQHSDPNWEQTLPADWES